jgi:RNA polymerase sigma-70 factor (ECF subfamily)
LPNPDPQLLERIHCRLLERDPTAPADLAELVLEPLAIRLRTSFPKIPDPDLIDDAVSDAVLNYAERPEQFDPDKRGLFGYLEMSATGDLKNAIESTRRRQRREESLDVVELPSDRRNKVSMPSKPATALEDQVVSDLSSQRLISQVRAAAETPQDAKVLELMIEGERRTDRFAEALGLEGLNAAECRRAVKRHKDRLKKRLDRLGLSPDD